MDRMQSLIDVLGMPFLACAAMTAILAYLGLHVLKREIVFVDLALAQIVAVGAIGAHLFLEAHEDSPLAYASSVGLALVAAAFYAFTRRHVRQISTEAVIGVSYAIAAATALFLLGVAPGGHVHAQHMLTGSILWATRLDLLVAAVAFAGAGACSYLLRKPLSRLTGDYRGALDAGMNVFWWDFFFYSLIGVVITVAVRIGGVVVVFCLLIIPASIGTLFARATLPRLAIAWTAGVVGSLLGLLFAARLDFSVGPSIALFLGLALAVATGWHTLRPLAAAGISGAVALACAAVFLVTPSTAVGGAPPDFCQLRLGARPQSGEIEEHAPGDEETEARRSLSTRYDEAPDSRTRGALVLDALEGSSVEGLQLAVRFLETDPPLFYRQLVVERLNERPPPSFDFDVTRPFDDPVNREAARALRRLAEEAR